jgi:hypothetical protein
MVISARSSKEEENPMNRIRLLAAAGILCLVGGLVTTTIPASAAVTAPAQTTVVANAASTAYSQVEAQPMSNKTCPVQYTRFRIYNSKCGVIKAYLCFTGNHGNFKTSPRYVSNGCIYRVWIYTAQDEHGEGLCINPHRPTSGLKKTYRSFKVVHNQDECPS